MTPFQASFWRTLQRTIRQSRARILRVTAITLASLLCLTIAVRLAAPYLISTSLVRNGMERAISDWTGHRAIIGGAPQLQFWPAPRITLEDVIIEKTGDAGDRTIARIDRMSASFNLVKAFGGRLQFRDFHFLRPHLFLTRDRNGGIDWTNKGLLARALADVKPGDGGAQLLDSRLNARIGSMIVEDGTLDLTDAAGGHFSLAGISADIAWPSLAQAIKAYVLVRVRDHDVKLDVASTQPLLLISGRNANASGQFTSPALTSRFDGIANLANYAFFSGNIEINAPNIPALLAWSGAKLPNIAKLKSASLTAEVMTGDNSLRFNNLRFSVDDTNASGVLDFGMMPATGRPKLTGTLAFDEVNVRAFLTAFSLNVPARDAAEEAADTTFMRQLDVDLRLSAQHAAIEPFELRDVGASVLIAQGKANFDIGDSAFEGGQMIAHLDVAESGFDGGGNLNISIRDADLESAAKRLSLAGPLPLGLGSLDIALKTTKPVWATAVTDISGSLKLYTGPGSLRQFDAAAFRALAGEKLFFRMSEAGNGTLDFESCALTADFANGSAEIKTAKVTGVTETLTLAGIVPYATNGMALAGSLQPTLASDTATRPLRFFAGGSWPDPVISPVSILTANPLQ